MSNLEDSRLSAGILLLQAKIRDGVPTSKKAREEVRYLCEELAKLLEEPLKVVPCKKYLGRPPKKYSTPMDYLQKWDGTKWVPDDGKPGYAFSGHGTDRTIPVAFIPECNCHDPKCPRRVAMDYTLERFGASNGFTLSRVKSK